MMDKTNITSIPQAAANTLLKKIFSSPEANHATYDLESLEENAQQNVVLRLEEAISKRLSPIEWDILRLRYCEGMKYSGIREALGNLSIRRIRNAENRALSKLSRLSVRDFIAGKALVC